MMLATIIFRIFMILLVLIPATLVGYIIWRSNQDRKEFFEMIKKHRRIGYIEINADGTSKFVHTNSDGSPVDPNT